MREKRGKLRKSDWLAALPLDTDRLSAASCRPTDWHRYIVTDRQTDRKTEKWSLIVPGVESMVLTTLLNSFSLTFPWFPGQNESFSPTNFFFTRNTSVGYQSLSIKGGYKGGETNLKIEVHIICEKKQAEKILNCCMQSQLKIFFCIFVNFCTLVLLYPLTSPDRRNHVTHGQPQKISFAKLSTYSYIEIKHLHLMCDGNLVERKQSSNSQVKALRSWLINTCLLYTSPSPRD